jgi:chemotaxis protein CheX
MSEPATIALPEVLDLKAAAPLHAQLSGLRGQPVVLDASRVQRLGGLCLQVLLAAEAAWSSDDQDFSLAQPTPEFDAGWTLFAAPPLPRVANLQE